jgi:hypothetical protein
MGVFGPVAAPLGQLDHAAPPDVRILTRLSDMLAVPLNVVKHETFAQRKIAESDLGGIDMPQNRVEQHAAGDDQVGAPWIEPGKLHAFGDTPAGHFLSQAMDLLRGNAQVPDFVRRAATLGGRHSTEAQNRP